MNALERIHASLVAGGLVVDTQPISRRPAVETSGRRIGSLDMRDWWKIIEAVDERVAVTVRDGLWVDDGEHRYVVTDTFESGAELVDTVTDWQGTQVSESLSRQVRAATGNAYVHQEVRMRVLRAV